MCEHKLFISYNSKDTRFVDRLTSDLDALGIETWHFKRDLVPGAIIWNEINRKISEYRKVAVVLSTDSINSEGVKSEIENAYRLFGGSGRIFIIPLLITELSSDIIPSNLQGLYWAEFSSSYYLGFQQLLKTFNINFSGLPESKIEILIQSKNLSIFSLRVLKLLYEHTRILYCQFILIGKEPHANRYVVVADSIPEGMMRYRLVSLNGLIGECLTSGNTVYSSDLKVLPNYLASEQTTKEELAIPVISNKLGVVGAFNFESAEMRLAELDRPFLESLGKIVGDILEKRKWLPSSLHSLPTIWKPEIWATELEDFSISKEEIALGIEQMQKVQDDFINDSSFKDLRIEERIIHSRDLVKQGFKKRAIKILKSAPPYVRDKRIDLEIEKYEISRGYLCPDEYDS